MPISNVKKCQTLINLTAQAAQQLQEIATILETAKTAYQTQSVDPTGTPLEGNITNISNWIDSVDTIANSAVATNLIAYIVSSHKNNALGG